MRWWMEELVATLMDNGWMVECSVRWGEPKLIAFIGSLLSFFEGEAVSVFYLFYFSLFLSFYFFASALELPSLL